jgi:hypothetical protein
MEKHEVTYASSVTSDKESIIDLMAERPEQGSSFLAYANVVCVVAGTFCSPPIDSPTEKSKSQTGPDR